MDFANFPLELFIPCLFFTIFPLFWMGITFLLGQLGGWAALAQVYRFDGQFHGDRWGMQSGRLGFVNYNHVLTVGANSEGLYMKPLFFFRFGQPPLFIPWYDISVERKDGLFSQMEYRFQRGPSVRLKLRQGLSNRLEQAAGEAWPG